MAPRKTEELKFTIDPKSGVPYYKQIILQIEMAIADNRLQQGNQLPTVRSLAVDLKVNPNTVAKAYNQLEIRGIVTTQQGTGTFISENEIKMDDVEREKILSQMSRDFLSKVGSYGFSIQDVIDHFHELQERE